MGEVYKGFTVPKGTDPPNGPGAFRELVDSLDTRFSLQYGVWRALPETSWDADSWMQQGLYYAATDTQAQVYLHVPIVGKAFVLEVLAATPTYIVQRITYAASGGSRSFERTFLGNVWSAWAEKRTVVNSGAVTLSLTSKYTAHADYPLVVSRVDDVLYLRGGVVGDYGPYTFATTPEGFRPTRAVGFPFSSSTGTVGFAFWNPNGNLGFAPPYQTGPGGQGLYLIHAATPLS